MVHRPLHSLSARDVWQWSRGLLVAALSLGLLLTLYLSVFLYDYLFLWPGLLLGGLGLAWAARDDLHLLCVILAGFTFVAGYEEGFQVSEAAYGLLYLSYLGYWFISRLFFYQDGVLHNWTDWALFVFLLYITASFGVTVVMNGDLATMVSQWLSMTMLAFYFPIKEACRRDPRAPRLLGLTFGFMATFLALRNFWTYRVQLTEAVELWQVATNRVTENEHVLMLCAIGVLAFWLHSYGWKPRLLLLGLLGLLVGGVIIGQSRAVWVSTLLGFLMIFLFVDRKRKVQLLGLSIVGALGAVGVGMILFDNFIALVTTGLIDRFASLQGAATRDLSLVNRFHEMGAVWDRIVQNPIIGYGFAVEYKYYSLVYERTWETSFIHNGYLGVWYRHGLFGFLLLYGFYVSALWHGLRLWMRQRHHQAYALFGLITFAALVAEALVANTENPFATSDKTLMIGTLAGLAIGLWERPTPPPPQPEAPPTDAPE